MAELLMNTKANVLLELGSLVKKSYVEDSYILLADDFLNDRELACKYISDQFGEAMIVVRSSSVMEDNMTTTNAGHFKSVLDVDASDRQAVCDAVLQVLESYLEGDVSEEKLAELSERKEQVLIQRQTTDIKYSGVVFTRDVIYNRPYYTVTYDDNGSTDSVTSGSGGKTMWIAQNVSGEFLDDDFLQLITAVKEIQKLYEDITALDIEFAIKHDGTVVIFQVRPLVAALNKVAPMTDREFKDTKAFAKCNYLDTFHILSDMAFWNPAEIIGSNPRPLDYSLYRELITAHIWNDGIVPLGYSRVEDELMQKIGNKPYISVNYTFDGLTPAVLSEDLKYKLKEYYEARIRADKTTHDKIEFEVILTIYDFSTDDRLAQLKEAGFSDAECGEIREALLAITRNAILNFDSICERDSKALEQLTTLRHELRKNGPLKENNIMKLYSYVGDLIRSIVEHGTPQFTRQARLAFMARSFCRSLVEKNYFSQDEMDAFLQTIPTVASDFERDFDLYSHGQMSRENFNHLYGHLRLGTYDIRSDSYRDMYFDVASASVKRVERTRIEGRPLDEEKLRLALEDAGLNITAGQMTEFIIKATQNREYFKFEFTKSLSLVLDIIVRMGELFGIAREDMSYLEIQDLLSYHSRDSYIQIIDIRRKMYHAYTYLVLPEVIFNVGDIDVIDIDEARPNFITGKVVEAEIVNLDTATDMDITGKIVVLTKADPGYDWIFTKDIAGFITKYGGAASHMAIRCAEFGIPAAIGCGEKIYQKVQSMTALRLDCSTGRITEI